MIYNMKIRQNQIQKGEEVDEEDLIEIREQLKMKTKGGLKEITILQ